MEELIQDLELRRVQERDTEKQHRQQGREAVEQNRQKEKRSRKEDQEMLMKIFQQHTIAIEIWQTTKASKEEP